MVFNSVASNLVAGDTNGFSDVFVRDRRLGVTERVSVADGGAQGNGDSGGSPWSDSGYFVTSGYVSDDGNIVALNSAATDLVPGDTNGKTDVFVRDRRARTTTPDQPRATAPRRTATATSTALSPDGRYVVFNSLATDLVPGDTNGTSCSSTPCSDVFLYDRRTRRTERISVSSAGRQGNGSSTTGAISADAKVISFASDARNLVPHDTDHANDVFVRIR